MNQSHTSSDERSETEGQWLGTDTVRRLGDRTSFSPHLYLSYSTPHAWQEVAGNGKVSENWDKSTQSPLSERRLVA